MKSYNTNQHNIWENRYMAVSELLAYPTYLPPPHWQKIFIALSIRFGNCAVMPR